MGLFEWIFNNLYIVAVIGFALFSFLGKAAKSADPNKKRPANGMPTFGGSGDSGRDERSRDNSSPQQSSGPADPAMMNSMTIGMMTCNIRISMMSRIQSLLHLLAPKLTTEVRAR